MSEKRGEYNKKWREENKKYYKEYRELNKEKGKEYAKKYYELNKEKRREQMRKWEQLNKEKRKEFQREYCKKKRVYCLEYLGGKCVKCGATERLEFDHIKREGKKYSIASKLSYKFDYLKEELDKCQLLCAPCHLDKTAKEWTK